MINLCMEFLELRLRRKKTQFGRPLNLRFIKKCLYQGSQFALQALSGCMKRSLTAAGGASSQIGKIDGTSRSHSSMSSVSLHSFKSTLAQHSVSNIKPYHIRHNIACSLGGAAARRQQCGTYLTRSNITALYIQRRCGGSAL